MRSDDFLSELKIEFRDWRRRKRFPNEAIPDDLLKKARAAAADHGVGPVAGALMVQRRHLTSTVDGELTPAAASAPTPAFSRIQLSMPTSSQPLMEAETPVGMKLRIFAVTPETVGVLSSFCRAGGAAL